MSIKSIRREKFPAVLAGLALLFSSFWAMQNVFAVGEITITAAPAGSVVLDGNGGAVLQVFSPDLGLATSTATTLSASSTASVSANYAVRVQSATTTGDVRWRITVDHSTDALTNGDVSITEKGYFDATGGTVADSAYSSSEVSGNLVLDGNAGWEVFAGDDFTNVDQITFSADAPLGTYTVTRVLIDNSSSTPNAEIGESFSFTVNLTAAVTPDINPPVFATTTDIFVSATSSGGVIVNFDNPTTTDDTDTDVEVICTPSSGVSFAVGSTTVTCTAEDDAGNTASTTFSVIVTHDPSPDSGVITITHPIFSSGLFCATATPVTLSGTADLGTTVTVTGGLASSTVSTNGSGNWTTTVGLASNATSTVIVTVKDSGGSVVATSSLNFAFDTTDPTITLNGDNNMTVAQGGIFTDPGVTVNDSLDANASFTTSGSVNMAVPGTYVLTYTAMDCAGNTAVVTRTVTVAPVNNGGGSRRREIPPGLLVASGVANPNSAVAEVLAGFVEGPASGQVLGSFTMRFTRGLRIGFRGDDVAELQRRLREMGLFRANITGYFGNVTAAAVRAFQRGLDLRQTGELDANTMMVLNES
ncbi:DUF5011 domain-containing protein [Candidatus Parcubacteria bacterium]|nr:DUF5011 domain-containing protein [Candidatus Parcubacteria bacterium]